MCASELQLRPGQDVYKPEIDVFKDWDFNHQPPGAAFPDPRRDQRDARPRLGDEVQPEPEGAGDGRLFRSRHALSTRAGTRCITCRSRRQLQNNIEYHYYPSGHMVYAHQESLKADARRRGRVHPPDQQYRRLNAAGRASTCARPAALRLPLGAPMWKGARHDEPAPRLRRHHSRSGRCGADVRGGGRPARPPRAGDRSCRCSRARRS